MFWDIKSYRIQKYQNTQKLINQAWFRWDSPGRLKRLLLATEIETIIPLLLKYSEKNWQWHCPTEFWAGGWKGCCEMLSSGHDVAIALKKPQQPRLPAQGQPCQSPSMEGTWLVWAPRPDEGWMVEPCPYLGHFSKSTAGVGPLPTLIKPDPLNSIDKVHDRVEPVSFCFPDS